MKIRTGFVSNSSSSSFVIMMHDDVRDKILAELSPYEKSLFNKLFSSKKFGNEFVNFFSGRVGTEATELLCYLGDLENEEVNGDDWWELYNSRSSAFYKIIKECERWRDKIILEVECH